MKIYDAAQMRAFDADALETYHLPGGVLMENAALRVVEFLAAKLAPLSGKHIAIFCGKGNNGGDGFAIARLLLEYDCRVTVVLAANPTEIQGDAQAKFLTLQQVLERYPTQAKILEPSEFDNAALSDVDVTLDALLGTGYKGVLRPGPLVAAFALLRRTAGRRVAIDIPSGLNADSGEAIPEAVMAEYTVTFAAPKRGFYLNAGVNLCGEIWVGDIGTGSAAVNAIDTGCELITRESVRALLPRRLRDAHKGNAGRVVVIGGSLGMSGAPSLAALATLKIGAGTCVACVPESIQAVFAAAVLPATSHGLACDSHGSFLENSAAGLDAIWKNAQVVALGPGLSRSAGALDFARQVVRHCPLPLVIDADALYALREIESDVKTRTAPTILTPHPGEMGELTELSSAEVQQDRLAVALACAKRYNATTVLKGAYTIVATTNGTLFINSTGNPGMATGGSGDVLTGTIAGLLAQGGDATTATSAAVFLHGLAGDMAYEEKGNGLTACDIVKALPGALLSIDRVGDDRINAGLCRI